MNSLLLSSSSSSPHEPYYLAPRTAARVVRDVQELLRNPEAGVRLIVDEATGLPANLRELTVRSLFSFCLFACVRACCKQ
jgi:hypothetical protein